MVTKKKPCLENLLDDVDSSGAPLDPKRDIEPEYQRMSYIVADLKRHLFTVYVGFLPPEQTSSAAAATSSSGQTHVRPSIPAMEKDKHTVNTALEPKKVLVLTLINRPNAAVRVSECSSTPATRT
jgi:hypothetical protein